jgi:outer membrane protein assembly factor BamB
MIWNVTTGVEVYYSPVVANGLVYIGSTDDRIYALNASNGKYVWSYTTQSSIASSPTFAGKASRLEDRINFLNYLIC